MKTTLQLIMKSKQPMTGLDKMVDKIFTVYPWYNVDTKPYIIKHYIEAYNYGEEN